MAWRLSYLLTCNRITLGTLGIGARKQGIGNVTLVISFVELFCGLLDQAFTSLAAPMPLALTITQISGGLAASLNMERLIFCPYILGIPDHDITN